MWFRRKKQESTEPVRQKRKPREWTLPKDNLVDVLKLYDDMMSSISIIGPTITIRRLLPRYLFWQKIVEILPDTRGLSLKVEETKDWQCIKLVEVVPDDEYESEPAAEPSSPPERAELNQLLDEIEAKPDLG
ncbi:MAG: hypothetical protein WC919_03175 [Candidatus Paceibacterota bacterium]|jgi:hypothetical protein